MGVIKNSLNRRFNGEIIRFNNLISDYQLWLSF